MKKEIIFGHLNPDTDSVCAAITLANLKNKLGINAEARVLGNLNNETKFALEYFGVKEPRFLSDVKLQIKDLNIRKNTIMKSSDSILEVYNLMGKENTTGVPIVDENGKLVNLITAKDILRNVFNNDTSLDTSYENILETLEGKEILKFTNDIKGNIRAVSYAHRTFESNIDLSTDDILIIGDRNYIIDLAIETKVKLIILIGGFELKQELYNKAKQNNINIISTKYDTYETANKLFYSNYISKIFNESSPISVNINSYYDDFQSKTRTYKVDNYPVVDDNNICKGLLRKSEIDFINKKNVVLVDHNELTQSATGIEEANLIEIVDHHKIGNLNTSLPINIRNMTVGSTNTIIYLMYKEHNIEITKDIAGLMMSAIISDTLNLNSPTTTDIDRKVLKELNEICNIDLDKYVKDLFKAASNLDGKTVLDIITDDLKIFDNDGIKISIGQVTLLNSEEITDRRLEFIKGLDEYKEAHNLEYALLTVTDVARNGSVFIGSTGSEDLINNSFNLDKDGFAKGIVSRKKQIAPKIIDTLNN